jgi:hypothetical protein
VTEPPKLYVPHAPVIVPKTSDGYACVPNNLKSLSSVLGKPESSMIFQANHIIEALQYYNSLYNKLHQSKSVEVLHNLSLQTLSLVITTIVVE